MLTTDALILTVAGSQHGVVTSAQLGRLGLTRDYIDSRIKAGILQPVHRGVYLTRGFPRTFLARAYAAVLACPHAALASRSAAYRLGIGPGNPPVIEILTDRSRPRTLAGVRIRRTMNLPDNHLVTVDGLTVTNAARTLFDASAVTGVGGLTRLIHRAVHQGALVLDDIHAVLDELGTRGHRGAGRLRTALAELGDGPPTESVLEDDVLELLRRCGLPVPERQVTVTTADGRRLRVDFLYRAERVVLEAEGRIWHSHPDDFQDDIERDQAYAELDLLKIPISSYDVRRRGQRVAAVIQAVLRSRRDRFKHAA